MEKYDQGCSHGAKVSREMRLLLVAATIVAASATDPSSGDPSSGESSSGDPDDALFTLLSGSAFCSITDGGSCFTDGPGNYVSGGGCTIQTNAPILVTATSFITEYSYDYLTIDGVRYEGAVGPRNVAVAAGRNITWSTDSAISFPGFVVCAVLVAPSPPPSAPAPPLPPPSPAPPPRPPLAPGWGLVSTVADLRTALLDSNLHTIALSSGHYPLNETIDISRSVTLKAEWPGTVVLDGQNAVRILRLRDGGSTTVRDGGISTSMAVTLDGLVLANGHYEAAAYEGGGAILMNGGTLIITGESIIRDSTVTGYSTRGGGVYNEGGNVILTDRSVVRGNRARGYSSGAGGLYNLGGSLNISGESIVEDNRAYKWAGVFLSSACIMTLT